MPSPTSTANVDYQLPLDVQVILGNIQKWFDHNQHRVQRAKDQNGGFEGWLQVELALAIQDLVQGASVHREIMVYKNSRKLVDLALKPNKAMTIGASIELKAEHATAKPATFCWNVLLDLDKIFGTGGKLENKWCPGRLWAVAFAYSDNIKGTIRENMERYAGSNGGHTGQIASQQGGSVQIYWACTDVQQKTGKAYQPKPDLEGEVPRMELTEQIINRNSAELLKQMAQEEKVTAAEQDRLAQQE